MTSLILAASIFNSRPDVVADQVVDTVVTSGAGVVHKDGTEVKVQSST